MIGRAGSTGFPNKNIKKVLGRRLFEYPLIACKNSKYVDKIFVSTDCPVITQVSKKYGVIHVRRPKKLAMNKALGEHVYEHGYFEIKKRNPGKDIEIIVLLFCNAVTVTSELIEEGIRVLRENPEIDSAVSASTYNMWSPLRARKIGEDGLLQPFVPFETFGDPKTLNCDRDSQGDAWFADMGVSIVRSRCLENIEDGLLPQKWMGQKIHPLKQWGGCDVDYEWQIPQVEYWLRKHGFTENSTTENTD